MKKEEAKFRALKDDMSDFKFVYGRLIYDGDTPMIQEDDNKLLFTTCFDGTVGGFTGLQDKNGVDIYGGDIVNVPYNNIGYKEVTYMPSQCKYSIAGYKLSVLEVIGNIHENNK